MTRDEIAASLRAGGLALAFDTNALFDDHRLIGLCSDVARINERLTRRGLPLVRLIVCTVAHTEKLFDLKQKFRDTFDLDVILQGLTSKGLVTQPFEAQHALSTGARLGELYPATADWRRAKKERCIRCVGLDPTRISAPGTGKRCGATVDWLITGHARAEHCFLVTDEEAGPEFVGLTNLIKLAALEAAVQQVLAEPV